jgi:uncharacterized protein with gpF-like domain
VIFNLENDRQRRRAQQQITRLSKQLEIMMIRLLKPAINRSFIDAAKLYRQGVADVESVVNNQTARLINIFIKQYQRVFATAGELVFDELEIKKIIRYQVKDAESIFEQAIRLFINQFAAQKVTTLIDPTTKGQLSLIIQRGLTEGLSNREISKLILKTGNIQSGRRAIVIAKTETHTAMTYGIDQAVASTGVEFEREWSTAGDERVRPSRGSKQRFYNHRIVDGQTRKQNEPFDVSGEKLMYPGDPTGSAGNIVQCRCILLYNS